MAWTDESLQDAIARVKKDNAKINKEIRKTKISADKSFWGNRLRLGTDRLKQLQGFLADLRKKSGVLKLGAGSVSKGGKKYLTYLNRRGNPDSIGNAARKKYALKHGFDLLYAESDSRGYATWTYSDGKRVSVKKFVTLEGLQRYAKAHKYAIIYVNPKRRKNPDALFSTKADALAALDFLKRHLAEFPYVSGTVMTLGGEHRATVMLTVSLDPRESWPSHILENSRYGKFSVDYNGEVKHFSGHGLGSMRKSHAKSVTDAGRKLREFLHKAPKSNPIKGPGKFEGETYAGRYAYHNVDEDLGDVQDFGWYGNFSGKIKGRGPFHIIVREDSQGFVYGEFFDTKEKMRKAWRRLEREYEKFMEESEE